MADTLREIKPWNERIGRESGVPDGVIKFAMLEEIAELREALASRPAEVDDKVEIFQAQVENGHWCDIEESSLSDWESMHIRTRCVLV